jgi:hypothetical protein
MAWTAPRTFVTDEFMTASMFNTNVRDNVGEAWREIELITGTYQTTVSSSAVYNVDAGTVIASFASRTYPGYPIEIAVCVPRMVSNVGNWAVLGVTDGTPGTTSPWRPLLQTSTENSGLGVLEIEPTPGVHDYKVAFWGGNGGLGGIPAIGSYPWYPFQARLLEKAGPEG